MEVLVLLIISFCLLMFAVLKNLFIGYPLIICWSMFLFFSLKKGFTFKEVLGMSYEGGKKSFVILKILILIGAVISIWMASGTIPSIVYYCLKYITPSTFLLSAFLICCMMSFLIGTALGTVSTIGIPLIILARSGNVSLNMAAGAIIAGAYFGDRCSPMSSSAVLVASLTKTNLFINIKNMLRSSIIPFLLSIVFYYLLSQYRPLEIINNNLSFELAKTFRIGIVMLVPAFIIILMSLFKVRMQISMLISVLCAIILSIFLQKYQLGQILKYAFWGFQLDNGSLQSIIRGGGIFAMLKTSLVIFTSCSLAGIFEGIRIFDRLKNYLLELNLSGDRLFAATSIVSTIAAAFGCTQTIAMIITNEIMGVCYDKEDNYSFSLDLENSGILISALIPWNIAALVPTTTMNVSTAGFLPYAFYIYALPIIYYIQTKYFKKPRGCSFNSIIKAAK